MSANYRLGQEIKVNVTRTNEPNFDRACETAWKMAMIEFGADGDGHLTDVAGYERSRHCVQVKFVTVTLTTGMGGPQWTYNFTAVAGVGQ